VVITIRNRETEALEKEFGPSAGERHQGYGGVFEREFFSPGEGLCWRPYGLSMEVLRCGAGADGRSRAVWPIIGGGPPAGLEGAGAGVMETDGGSRGSGGGERRCECGFMVIPRKRSPFF